MTTLVKTLLILWLAALSGCSALPSMQYCDQVSYTRNGTHIIVHAECTAPVGGGL